MEEIELFVLFGGLYLMARGIVAIIGGMLGAAENETVADALARRVKSWR